MTTDFMIFVEDPGAANFVAELPTELKSRGHSSQVFARATGARQLAALEVPYEDADAISDAGAMLDATAPRMLVAGTSENQDAFGLALLQAARAAGLPSVGALDSPINAGFRFRGRSCSPLTYAPDCLLVPDEQTRAAMAGVGFDDGRMVVCGHPHHDHVRSARERLDRSRRFPRRAALLPGAAPAQKVVVFLTEISSGPDPTLFVRDEHYTLTGREGSDRRTDIVLETLLDGIAAISPRPYVVLRLHPKNRPEDFAAYGDEIDFMSAGGSPLELIAVSDLVVGMTTVLMVEAALLGRPTLSIVPTIREREWLPTIGAGITPCANDAPTALCLLNELLDNPPPDAGAALDRMWPRGATGRAVDVLVQVLGARSA